MAQSKHTPGPWEYEVHELSEGYSAIVYDEHGIAIADHLAEANARLIAAAPELLAQLRIVTDDLEKVLRARGFRDDPKVLAARAILAKAEGGAA